MLVTNPRTVRTGRNLAGRDFVVGDVHGCFRTLEHAFGQVSFHPERNRLLSVADLANRGSHSHEAIDWLITKRIEQAVMGSHEAIVLEVLADGQHQLHASWVAGIRDEDLVRWIVTLEELPLALTVEAEGGRRRDHPCGAGRPGLGADHPGVGRRAAGDDPDRPHGRVRALVVRKGGDPGEGTPRGGDRTRAGENSLVRRLLVASRHRSRDRGNGPAHAHAVDGVPMETRAVKAVPEERRPER